MMPSVGIILLTYQRTDYARRTIASVCKHLRYSGDLYWYVADDGSTKHHFDEVRACIISNGGSLYGAHQTGEVRGYGVNANKAWVFLHKQAMDVTFWLEDDWVMVRDFDITPHVKTLLDGYAGMIRTTYIPLGSMMTSVYFNNQYYLSLVKDGLYTYSGNPHLKHHDFALSYGLLPEGRNPGDTEIAYDHIVRHSEGSPIFVPAEVHSPPFIHIGEEKSYG